MKRTYSILMALVLVTLAATPALAQGPSTGDRLCTGGSMLISSNETIDSLLLFGCGARIQSGARVLRDVVSFGGDVAIEKDAVVNGGVVLFGGDLDLAGTVNRDVTMMGGNATLESSSVVDRDLVVLGGTAQQAEGAVVRGRVTRGQGFQTQIGPFRPLVAPVQPFYFGSGIWTGAAGIVFDFVRSVIYALALAALGALTIVFLPTQTKQIGDTAQTSALPSLGVGCLTLVLALPLFILLLILIITIPIALLLPPILIVAWIFGWIALGRLAGERLLQAFNVREILPIAAVIVGVLALTIVGAVPLIGGLVSLIVGSIGLGAVILTRFGTRAYPPLVLAAATPAAPSAPAAQAALPAPAAPADPVSGSSGDTSPS